MSNSDYKEVKKVLWGVLVLNILVSVLKILMGVLIKSASMTADGLHSMSDASSNIVGIVGVSIASKPKDEKHPYGHKKFEIIASMFIGFILFLLSINIVIEGIDSYRNSITPNVTIESIIILFVTLIINILVSTYENKMGKKLNSHILISDSIHTKSDVFVSIGVLLTLISMKLGIPPIVDIIVSFIISGLIFYSAYEIFRDSIGILVDTALIDDDDIKKIVDEFSEIKGVHNIRSRGSKNDMHIDMHILLDPKVTIEHAHDLSHSIERSIRQKINKNAQVILHIEPFYDR